MPKRKALTASLRASGATLAPGLSEPELQRIESTFAFVFAPDHRLMLSLALPLGERFWPDWRGADEASLRGRLAWPTEGILFDVENNGYWNAAWGDRPTTAGDALDVARALTVARVHLDDLPPLVPVFAHRYLPTVPSLPGNPVLSCYQTDVIYYGDNLLEWFDCEFHKRSTSTGDPRRIPFWTDLIESDE